jgi:aerobic carbon-monoxide dehydrogenase large subunit
VDLIGAPLRRLEDARLLAGRGQYVDDVTRPGLVHAVIVRSPHAHACIRAIDVARATAEPGVLACLTAGELGPVSPIGVRLGPKPAYAAYLQSPLAGERARYVGEPVAVVVATDRARAVDASELVRIDWAPLPALTDAGGAAAHPGPALFPEGNVADAWTTTLGDVDAALSRAACVVRERLRTGRQTGAPLEPRGLVAEWDAGRLTVWGATKAPYFNRRTLAAMLGLAESQIDFVATDVGGGFGSRGEFYPEDFLVPYLARRLGRPVKWVEDRREHFLTINHSREQHWSVALAVDAQGRLLALDAALVNDMGAYLRTHGTWVAALSASYLPGPYRLPAYRCRVECLLTNKTPTGTVRAPGFFEASFVRERMMDIAAARLGLDPAEIRRRNLVAPGESYPVNAVARAVIGRDADFGGEDFGAMFEAALEAGRYEARVAACRERNAAGGPRRSGVGLAAVVETSGVGPFETARVSLTREGTLVLASGATPVGQGIATTLAQVCGEALGVAPADIAVHLGDTRFMPDGVGSYGSRSAVMAGSAVHQAATQLRERIIAIAARHFEASPADIVLDEGAALVRGVPDRRCSLREVAALAGTTLEADARHASDVSIGSLSVHLAVASVDVTTGAVYPETHVVLADVGRAINPLIVEGQLTGGVLQGLGHALQEQLVYDAGGQLVTGSFMEYALPTAAAAPSIEVVTHHAPATSNPLGVKGAGEAGTSGVAAALANAVASALGPGAGPLELPLTAPRIRAVIEGASRDS